MLSMLLAYDADGNVIATLDYMVARDGDDKVAGLVDFAAHEAAGAELTDVWTVGDAAGSKSWPEWLGARAHDFRVELEGPPGRKRIGALVHRDSGVRRERAPLEAQIAGQLAASGEEPADIRDLVGGPTRPLELDDEGRTLGPRPTPRRPALPVARLEAT
jgi:hypothetical protein